MSAYRPWLPAGLLATLLAGLLASLVVALAARPARAEEGRFDATIFRPSAAPRDLVMVEKSEVIGSLSPTVGLYSDLGFDPLVFVNRETGQTIDAVGARLQLTALAGIGLLDWADLKLALPLVAWQTSDNLRVLGTEGTIQTAAFGDLRLSARLAIPGMTRRSHPDRGLGMALSATLGVPTGAVMAFAGDGAFTGGLTLITDYRLGLGALVTANLGIRLRPDRQLAGVAVGDMASVALAGEAYLVQRWGLSVLGGLYGYPSLTRLPDSPRQLPAEALLALRWQTPAGLTWTFGGSFGAACGFGAPALRLFSGVTLHLAGSREQEHIERLLRRNAIDPDRDGLTSDVDRCPEEPGLPENRGCPDRDRDRDGVIDREDRCPDQPAGDRGEDGCPVAFIHGDQIVILDKVHFATDSDVILGRSKPVIDAVAQVLLDHPEILEVRIEGHTDIRASDAYNVHLSQRRVESVRDYLIARGVVAPRLTAKGYGHLRPRVDDSRCDRPDDQLDADCLRRTAQNRRVEFHIVRWAKSDQKRPRER